MAKYDDASWHYGGEYPAGLPNENAATHIGMFLAWCINNDLASELQLEDNEEDINKVKNRILTGADFLIDNCDEKFTDEDLNETGNQFAIDYYQYSEETDFSKAFSNYLDDYAKVLNNSTSDGELYKVTNSWENYDLLEPVINQRFNEWKDFISHK